MSSKKNASGKATRKTALPMTKRGKETKPKITSKGVDEVFPLPMDEDEPNIIEKESAEAHPDEGELLEDETRFEEIASENPLELLENPAYSVELSEDPVRLYLREIGQIHLLDANSEFRLATRNEGRKRIDSLESGLKTEKGNDHVLLGVFQKIIQELIEKYQTLIKLSKNNKKTSRRGRSL